MNTLTLAEIETILASEGLSAMSMDHHDSREGQTARMGAEGEYDITDFMEGDNSPESQAIINQFMELGMNFLQDEFNAEEAEDDYEEPAPRKAWGWLKQR